MSQNFKYADMVKNRKTGAIGVIQNAGGLMVMVAWNNGDVDCWLTELAEKEFEIIPHQDSAYLDN